MDRLSCGRLSVAFRLRWRITLLAVFLCLTTAPIVAFSTIPSTTVISSNIDAHLPIEESSKMKVKDDDHVKIDAVIFDLDGTLLDTERLSDEAMLYVLFGLSKENTQHADDLLLPWELKSSILGLRGSEWSPMVLEYFKEYGYRGKSCGDLISPEQLWARWECRLNELCSDVTACAGARELVVSLAKRNIPMAIATSSQRHAVEIKRKNHSEIFDRIKVIVTGDDDALSRGKPSPDIYLLAADRLGVRPERCLVFEDAMSGVLSASNAGCQVIAVPDLRMDTHDFHDRARLVLSSLEDFVGEDFGINL